MTGQEALLDRKRYILDCLPKDAYVFDFDGTLVDTESVWLQAYTTMLERHGIVADVREAHQRMLGRSAEDCIRILQEAFPRLPKGPIGDLLLLKERTDLFRLIRSVGITPMPGAAEFLSACSSDGIPLAIVSSAHREDILPFLEPLFGTCPFAVVISADDVTRHKPAPDAYLQAADLLRVEPESCVAFEDGESGLHSAFAAGMKTVFVRDSRFGIEPTVPVYLTVDSFTELLPEPD